MYHHMRRLACEPYLARLSSTHNQRRESHVSTLTPRAREVLERVQSGQTAASIAGDLSVSRNAIYQQIGKLRREGFLPSRVQEDGAGLSVEDTVDDIRSQLDSQLVRLDARTEALTQELERLRKERLQVKDLRERLDLE
jgi:DNA-binding CsgD family transcriptional regulator